ncbi:hypothetical protein CFOL_v3_03111 [Cephalotus follicularis]|uniref:Uncharacterized protein n=1 Tax=Cephalotus follicularis TaxID=3775 RepID=A0A1Q3AV74_CEPFO|nr:hypothetical protein CFOL_v3_03111 [Cephalotus follicularis]
MGEDTEVHKPEEAELEEALSLYETNQRDNEFHGFLLASPEPTEFFEFFNDLTSEMRPAEDIIFHGKLIPFNEPPVTTQTPKTLTIEGKRKEYFRRRSESLPAIQSSIARSNSINPNALMRNSRSLDHQKLNRFESSKILQERQMERNSSVRSVGKSEVPAKNVVVKPWWYMLMFGMVKFPAEMELRDIKSRQFRRNPSVMFPTLDHGNNYTVNRSSKKDSSYKFLKALSCKGHASVAVTASLCVPQV